VNAVKISRHYRKAWGGFLVHYKKKLKLLF
jgi:hypothetical protein